MDRQRKWWNEKYIAWWNMADDMVPKCLLLSIQHQFINPIVLDKQVSYRFIGPIGTCWDCGFLSSLRYIYFNASALRWVAVLKLPSLCTAIDLKQSVTRYRPVSSYIMPSAQTVSFYGLFTLDSLQVLFVPQPWTIKTWCLNCLYYNIASVDMVCWILGHLNMFHCIYLEMKRSN